MHLLPVKQAKEANDSQTQSDIIRANEAKLELKHVLQELAKAEAAFEVAMKNQHLRQINEETEHGKAITALKNEIKALEKRRDEALIPIEAMREEVHTKLIEVEKMRDEQKERLIELDEQAEVLEQKMDDASEQLEALTRRTAELNRREQGIKKQEEMTKKFVEEVTVTLGEKSLDCELREKKIIEKEKALQLQEIGLNSEKESIERHYAFIREEKVRLKDREQTLERAFNRIENGKKSQKLDKGN